MTTSMTRWLGGALALALMATAAHEARAAGTVTNCDTYGPGEGTLQEALAGGGTVTFACDGTIIVPEIVITADTEIDGTGQEVRLSGNDANRVLRVNSGRTLTLRKITVARGLGDFGGGVLTLGGTIHLESTSFIENRAIVGAATGGAMFIAFSPTSSVNSARFIGNTSSFGGAMAIQDSDVTIDRTIFVGNTSTANGGALQQVASTGTHTSTVQNSTFSNNTAGGAGGAILNFTSDVEGMLGTLRLLHTTISNNAGNGAVVSWNLLTSRSEVIMANSIIADQASGADCGSFGGGALISEGYNLDGDGTCNLVELTDFPNTDPQLGVLTDNGGSTETHALLPDSPAIDHIPTADCLDLDGAPLDTDQRGVSRPQPAGGNCDIGAFELVQQAPPGIADVIDLFDQAVADGTLMGAGPGRSGAGRLNALRNMLLTAGDLLDQGDVHGACAQLRDAADRTDGTFPPPDFVQGDAADDLFDAITDAQDQLGCFDLQGP